MDYKMKPDSFHLQNHMDSKNVLELEYIKKKKFC